MSEGKVTRIKAQDDKKVVEKAPKAAKTAKVAKEAPKKKLSLRRKKSATPKKQTKIGTFFSPITGYFKGSWAELKQVRWPNRKATWGLTVAVILFSIFFAVLITLLDTFFKFIFQIILGN